MKASMSVVLEKAVTSFQSFIPTTLTVDTENAPKVLPAECIVSIGLTGDVTGQLLIKSDEVTLSNLATSMFGMAVEGSMLQSFTCELGNMLAGNFATEATQHELNIDITPPTFLTNYTHTPHQHLLFKLPLKLEDKGFLEINISVNKELSNIS
ncbi:chemotaxis protein CheX [Priestia koreensis]|uniref:chemotaxis protein CheX n=1 Tax=Priestia koreensis TaxID=284581 RepID=UPI00203FF41A|nr:chemotaxis protein CheX [Priestia koreensis]MCM3003040.1 chemotaxis protein CheX [Priestia koreensis]